MHTSRSSCDSSNRIAGLTKDTPTTKKWMKQTSTTTQHYKQLKSHIRPPAWQHQSQHSFSGCTRLQSGDIGQSASESGGAPSRHHMMKVLTCFRVYYPPPYIFPCFLPSDGCIRLCRFQLPPVDDSIVDTTDVTPTPSRLGWHRHRHIINHLGVGLTETIVDTIHIRQKIHDC